MSGDRPRVREARAGELAEVMGLLDAAMLDIDAAAVAGRIESGTVLVAEGQGALVGACVVSPATADATVEAIAVRPGRRGGGVGSALIEAAANRWGTLVAAFDPDVRPFYESLGFEVEPVGADRLRGRREA